MSPDTATTEIALLADRLFAAAAAGDVDAVRACYAPHAVMRNHAFGVTQDRDGIELGVAHIGATLKDLAFEDVRRSLTSDGFVQQHVLRGTNPSGERFSVPACCVAVVANGEVVEIDEYGDSAGLGSLGL